MNALKVYHRLPITVQNLACTVEGAHIKYQRYTGSFHRTLKDVRAFEKLSPQQVADVQEKKLRKILDYAFKHVPYYRDKWARVIGNLDNMSAHDVLKMLPFLTREEVKQNSTRFISDKHRVNTLIDYPTGGTSGTPLVMKYTLDEIRANFAFGEARIRNWAGVSLTCKHATFLGKLIVPPGQHTPPYWRSNRAGNQTLFSIFHLSDSTVESYVRELERLGPEVIVGYVVPLFTLARHISRSGHRLGWTPKLIWTSSETLLDYQRHEIESAFGCPVRNAYSSAEGVTFISECPNRGLHISPDYGVTELVPIVGRSGLSEIVGTTLMNYSMPLIRYRTGDLVEPSPDGCRCGLPFPVVRQVYGRQDDAIVTPTGVVLGPAPLSLVFQDTLQIREAQLIQVSSKEVLVRIVPDSPNEAVPIARIAERLSVRLGEGMLVRTEIVQSIPRTQSGKFRFIVGLADVDRR